MRHLFFVFLVFYSNSSRSIVESVGKPEAKPETYPSYVGKLLFNLST